MFLTLESGKIVALDKICHIKRYELMRASKLVRASQGKSTNLGGRISLVNGARLEVTSADIEKILSLSRKGSP